MRFYFIYIFSEYKFRDTENETILSNKEILKILNKLKSNTNRHTLFEIFDCKYLAVTID